jgi:predicted amidohydrolase YtcJ
MTTPRVDHVLRGPIVVSAGGEGPEMAAALGLAGDRVVAVGRADEVLDAARPGATVTDVRDGVVVPGLHDFHLHLAAMARARHGLRLDEVESFDALLAAIRAALGDHGTDAWLVGRGWHEEAIDQGRLDELDSAVGDRCVALASHDGHSLWASAAARRAAGIGRGSADPAGGRIERRQDGEPNGVLREAALRPVEAVRPRLRGSTIEAVLRRVLEELAGWGITSITDAGDPDDTSGAGPMAALGDSFSTLHDLSPLVAGRVRLTLNLPVAALDAAAGLGLRSGAALEGGARVGWAKVYGDGALGSRTAALFEPYTCGAHDAGILRYEPDRLAALVGRARDAGIALAIHAIGDRAVAVALEALEARAAVPAALPDRIEHAQLVRTADRERFARAGVTASVQPIHAVSDRDLVDDCWRGREANAYTFASLLAHGARLAFGSDAPIEDPNPWRGLHAAIRRHAAGDGRDAWHPHEALSPSAALAGYTSWAAVSGATPDLGHLRPGALADLAVLDTDPATLQSGDEQIAGVRSLLTLLGGRTVHAA